MVTVRTAKNKGSAFEMDCEASLQEIYPDCFRTHERGYILQYDLRSDLRKLVVECKRMKSLSWNEALRYLRKLENFTPQNYDSCLLFKSNQQPCLVMQRGSDNIIRITPFEDYFGTSFIKHLSTRQAKYIQEDKQL